MDKPNIFKAASEWLYRSATPAVRRLARQAKKEKRVAERKAWKQQYLPKRP